MSVPMPIPLAILDRINVLIHGESSWRLRMSVAMRTMTILAMSGDLRWTALGLGLGVLSRVSVSMGGRIAVAWRDKAGLCPALLSGWPRRC